MNSCCYGRKIIEKIQAEVSEAQYYTIIADESKEYLQEGAVVNYPAVHLSLHEIFVIIHEIFVGYTHATELNATALSEYIL